MVLDSANVGDVPLFSGPAERFDALKKSGCYRQFWPDMFWFETKVGIVFSTLYGLVQR